MSTKIGSNVKSVILGCHAIYNILAKHESRFLSGYSPLVIPRAVALSRSYDYYKQPYVRRSTLDHAEALLPRQFEKSSLEKPVISKWLDEVLNGPNCTPAWGLPWESSYSFYYDKKCPQCPPSAPESRTDCPKSPVKPCPPPTPKLIPTCPQKPICYPCNEPKKSDPCAKTTPATMKTTLLNTYRFYSGSPCPPRDPPKKKAEPCQPTPKCDPQPKCDSKPRCVYKACVPKQKESPKECDPKPRCEYKACVPKQKESPKKCDPKPRCEYKACVPKQKESSNECKPKACKPQACKRKSDDSGGSKGDPCGGQAGPKASPPRTPC